MIVGGSGFLGKNLIDKLKFLNFVIYSVSRKIPKIKDHKVIYYKVDISKEKDLKKIKKINFNYVINFGGNIDHKNYKETNEAHFIGTQKLLKAINLNYLNLFIQIGSSLEYGNRNSPQSEKAQPKPTSIYGKAKLKASNFLNSFCKKNRIKFIILRPYQIYGPYQKFDRLIPQVIKSCLANKKFDCTNGNQLRDFLYVDDFINLILKIIQKTKINSGIYNVGYGKPEKVNFVIKKINNLIQKGHPNFGKIKMRKDEIMCLYPNINKVKKNFKWTPKTKLAQGLKKTLNFYKNV